MKAQLKKIEADLLALQEEIKEMAPEHDYLSIYVLDGQVHGYIFFGDIQKKFKNLSEIPEIIEAYTLEGI